jgi:hypothetical protein
VKLYFFEVSWVKSVVLKNEKKQLTWYILVFCVKFDLTSWIIELIKRESAPAVFLQSVSLTRLLSKTELMVWSASECTDLTSVNCLVVLAVTITGFCRAPRIFPIVN